MKPRICMPTARDLRRKHCTVVNVKHRMFFRTSPTSDVIHLEPGRGYKFRVAWLRRLLFGTSR